MAPEVKTINPNGVIALAKDVEYLSQFVDSLNNPILRENLDELQQTVQLMQADNADEFYDISTRNKKYGRVDAMQGPVLLEKYVACLALPCLGLGWVGLLLLNGVAFTNFSFSFLGLLEPSKRPRRWINLWTFLRGSRRLDIILGELS